MNIYASIILSCGVFVLASCGGGSSSENTSIRIDPQLEAVTLDRENAPEIAANVSQFILEPSFEVPNVLSSATPELTQSTKPNSSNSDFKSDSKSNNAALSLLAFKATTTAFNKTSFTNNCEVSGSSTVTGNFQDDISDDIDDSEDPLSSIIGIDATITYNDCIDQEGEKQNGTLEFNISELTGGLFAIDDSDYTIRFEFGFNQYQVVSDIESESVTESLDGEMQLFSQSSSGIFTDQISSNNLSISKLTSLENKSFNIVLSNYLAETVQVEDEDGDLLTYRYTVSGNYSDSTMDNELVTIETVVDFTGNADENPSEGSILITGANNTSMLITAQNSVDVLLEIDTNGDGAVDETVMTSWQELQDNSETILL